MRPKKLPIFRVVLQWHTSENVFRTKRATDKRKTVLNHTGPLLFLQIWQTLAYRRLRNPGGFWPTAKKRLYDFWLHTEATENRQFLGSRLWGGNFQVFDPHFQTWLLSEHVAKLAGVLFGSLLVQSCNGKVVPWQWARNRQKISTVCTPKFVKFWGKV